MPLKFIQKDPVRVLSRGRVCLALLALLSGSVGFDLGAAGPAPFDWARQAGGDFEDSGEAVCVDGSGNVYLAGYFESPASFGSTQLGSLPLSQEIFLAKYSQTGALQWVEKAGGIGGDRATGIALDEAGSVFITGWCSLSATFGSTNVTAAARGSAFVAKYNSLGSLQWVRVAGGENESYGNRIAVDRLGNAYVVGYFLVSMELGTNTLISGGAYDMFVAKYSGAGDLLWARQAGGSSLFDTGEAVGVDAQGNCYVTGLFSETTRFGSTNLVSAGDYDFFLSRYDSAGNLAWAQRAGGASFEGGTALGVQNNGECYALIQFNGTTRVGGTSFASAGNYDVLLVKFDSAGRILFARQAGGVGLDIGNGIVVDGAGNCFLTGRFNDQARFGSTVLSSVFEDDVFVAKYTREGTLQWAEQGGGRGRDEGRAIALDRDGRCYVSGRFEQDAMFGSLRLTNNHSRADIFLARRTDPDVVLFVNQPPNFSPGPNQTVFEDSGLRRVLGWASAISPGPASEEKQRLTFLVTNNNPGLFVGQPTVDAVGILEFTPARNAFGAATVSVMLHDDGGTANGGDDTSAPETFVVTIMPVNDPPVAVLAISPLLALFPMETNLMILSPNNSNATVVLDASLSHDVENDPLRFLWLHQGTLQAAGIRVTNLLGIGKQTIVLHVDDGIDTSTADSEFMVITPGEAVETVLLRLMESDLSRRNKRPLAAALKAAIVSFDRGHHGAGINQLQALQQKLRAQLAPVDPAVAETIDRAIQRMLQALGLP